LLSNTTSAFQKFSSRLLSTHGYRLSRKHSIAIKEERKKTKKMRDLGFVIKKNTINNEENSNKFLIRLDKIKKNLEKVSV